MYAVGILINALWSQEKPYKNVQFGALKLLQDSPVLFEPIRETPCFGEQNELTE